MLATKAGAARTLAAKLRPETLALPRLLRLGLGPLRQPRPGRLRGRERDPQQARARARPPLARPRRLDRLGPVAHDRHGLAGAAGGVRAPRRRADPDRRGLPAVRAGAAHGRKGEAEVVIGGATALAGAPRVAPPAAEHDAPRIRCSRSTAPVTRRRTARSRSCARSTSSDDVYLDDHRIDGRPICRSRSRWSCMAETAAAANPALEFAGLRDIRVLKGDHASTRRATASASAADADAGSERPRRWRRRSSRADGARPHYRARRRPPRAGARRRGGGRPPALDDLAPFPMTRRRRLPRAARSTGRCSSGSSRSTGMDERGASALLAAVDAGRAASAAPTGDVAARPGAGRLRVPDAGDLGAPATGT